MARKDEGAPQQQGEMPRSHEQPGGEFAKRDPKPTLRPEEETPRKPGSVIRDWASI